MNKYIIIKVVGNINRFIGKCNKYNIELYNIDYVDKDIITVKINKNDLDIIKKYNYYSEISIYKFLGIDYIKDSITKLKYLIIMFSICIIGLFLTSNIIFKVDVIHSNKKVRELVIEELEKNGIKKYSLKKSFKELESIKENILNNNKDKLEWLSITNVGMTYVIRVEERIMDFQDKKEEYCNIISTKEALIKKIYSSSGEIKVNNNDIVRKDDILISGIITLNEENKGYTCASGSIIGNVWYKTSIKINKVYYKKEYTGNKRYNFSFKNKILRNNKYNDYDKKYIIKNKSFSLYKELEYKNKKNVYTDKEGIKKALYEIDNKFKTKLKNNGRIIKKTITNKYTTDDFISLDVFVVTEEEISKKIVLEHE